MKKTILTSVLAAVVCASAYASDGIVTETETTTTYETFNVETVVLNNAYVAPRMAVRPMPRVAGLRRPCGNIYGEPVHVKTHTEVIDHYQVYQPVTVYQPAGTYATRRIVPVAQPCSRCAQ